MGESILLISDNSKDILTVRMMLADVKGETYDIQLADSLEQGLSILKERRVALVLLDLSLKGNKGLDVMRELQSHYAAAPIVILTGRENQAVAFEAVKRGAQDYLVKGKLDSNLLFRVIHYALERHRVMEEMKKKNEELVKLNALKSEFVSTVSHELRTPLTVVMSAANNLTDGAFGAMNGEQEKWVEKIRRHAMKLKEMIDDILDLSKLQSGKAQIRMAPLNFGQLLQTVTDNLQMFTQEKNLVLKCNAPASLPWVNGDAGRLEQVLSNLITNAIKFTPHGGCIEVSAFQDGGFVTVKVADSGPGIALENRQIIFERFRQIRQTENQESSTQGIGLGLAICKEIVTQHDGKIWVESAATGGSQFLFRLPATRVQRKAA